MAFVELIETLIGAIRPWRTSPSVVGEGPRLAEVADDAVHDDFRHDRNPRASQVEFDVQPVNVRNYASDAAAAAIQAFAFGS